MPRDKKLSHQRVLEAAKKEFLEKGFEGASIRTIGSSARMTSAGLYRHCKDKEDLFDQIVEPMVLEMNKRFSEHKKISYGICITNWNEFGSCNCYMAILYSWQHTSKY